MLWQLLAVIGLGFLTYVYTIYRGGFVIDDVDGIEKYDGKIKEKSYYHFIKHFWYLMAGKSPRRHHWFSTVLQAGVCGMLYLYLEPMFGRNVAFLTSLLFAVHPINNQSVAWISGRGYPLGLFLLLISLQVPKIISYYPVLETLPVVKYFLFSFFFIWALVSQFTIMFTFPVLWFQGEHSLAVLAFFIALVSGLLFIRDVIKHRTQTFKAQAMGDSTKLHWRKIIVVFKTLAYYTQLCIFPAHIGIYHKWGYHYDKKLESENNIFWLGVLLFIAFGFLYGTGPALVKFSIIWYFSYIFIFLNWITIHQFVSERYCYIANIGLCLLLASYLVQVPIAAAFIIGLLLMRTWLHLPTYCDQIRFYLSNIWNFPDSEVAMANLGVVLIRCGLGGMAVDYWQMATKANPGYDVPWYNLYSTFKMRGDFNKARQFLANAISSPTCHFKEQWVKELQNFNKELITNKNKMAPGQFPVGLTGKIIDSSGLVVEVSSANLISGTRPKGQAGEVNPSNVPLSRPTT